MRRNYEDFHQILKEELGRKFLQPFLIVVTVVVEIRLTKCEGK